MKNKYSIIIIPPEHEKAPQQIHFTLKAKKVVIISSAVFGLLFSGVFIHDVYQARYINSYKQKIAYIDNLEMEVQAKNLEIARLNQKTAEINDNLLAITSMEKKIAGILKLNPETSGSDGDKTSSSDNSGNASKTSNTANPEVSRSAFTIQSVSPVQSLDQAATLLDNHKEVITKFYDASVKYEDKENRTPSLLPVNGPITSSFGYRRNPFGGWSSEFHTGVDIACPSGTPVMATADGTVTFAGWDGYWGWKAEINHGFGVSTFYAHNSKLLVHVGDKVKKGQIISRSGNTGRSTGSHLHYTAYVNGDLVDPLIFTTYSKEQ